METFAFYLNGLGELELWDTTEDAETERPCDLLVKVQTEVVDWCESLDLHIQRGDRGIGHDVYI